MVHTTWAHASLAVLVPVTARPDRKRTTTDKPWDLERLFPQGHVVANPNKVAWEPIRDARIAGALRPTCTEQYLPVAATATGSNADDSATADADADDSGGSDDTEASDGSRDAESTSEPKTESKPEPLAPVLAAAGWVESTAGSAEVTDNAHTVRLPEGCTVRAVEVLHYDTPTTHGSTRDTASFIVVHLLLKGPALADPGRVAAFFGRTAQKNDQRTGYPNKSSEQPQAPRRVLTTAQWRVFCRALDFEPIGPEQDLRVWRPFVISHLVPHTSSTPPAPFRSAGSMYGWDPTGLWAWRMTAGQWLTQTWEPPRGVEDTTRDGSWLGSTWTRSSPSALTFVGTRGVDEAGSVHDREGAIWWRKASSFENVEHVRVASLVHRNAVWLAALVMRQSEELQQHSVALTNDIVWPAAPTGTAGGLSTEFVAQAEAAAEQALGLEYRLLQLRNKLWFTAMPGHEVETQVLAQMQGAGGLPALLADIEAEQQQVTRVLDQQSARVRRDAQARAEKLAAEEAERQRAAQARAEEQAAEEAEAQRVAQVLAEKAAADKAQNAADREKRTSNRIGALTTFLGLFFILDTALAIAQVWQNGGWDDVGVTVAFAGPVVLLVALVIAGVMYQDKAEKSAGWLKRLVATLGRGARWALRAAGVIDKPSESSSEPDQAPAASPEKPASAS